MAAVRILLLTAGSRGDVEPFVALGERACAEGHEVRLVAPRSSGADTSAVDTLTLTADFSRVVESQGVSPLAAARSFRSVVRPLMRSLVIEAAQAALDYQPDVVVHHPKVLSAPLAADALAVPHVLAELVPTMTPTRAFPAAGTVPFDLGPANPLTYRLATAATAMFRTELAEVRALVGAPPGDPSPPAATLLPISPALLPRPADWPTSVHLTGAWSRAHAPVAPDPEVADFVSRGPFLYAGFGSMAFGDASARGRAVVDAARAQGLRCLVATGLGGIAVPTQLHGPDVLVVTGVPHDAVLPHATLAVHHGGIGTVQAAMRAGVPSVIVPFVADQPFWAARLHAAGLAPPPVSRRALSVTTLGRGLEEAERCRPAVQRVAAQMAHEDGTATALRVLTTLA